MENRESKNKNNTDAVTYLVKLRYLMRFIASKGSEEVLKRFEKETGRNIENKEVIIDLVSLATVIGMLGALIWGGISFYNYIITPKGGAGDIIQPGCGSINVTGGSVTGSKAGCGTEKSR